VCFLQVLTICRWCRDRQVIASTSLPPTHRRIFGQSWAYSCIRYRYRSSISFGGFGFSQKPSSAAVFRRFDCSCNRSFPTHRARTRERSALSTRISKRERLCVQNDRLGLQGSNTTVSFLLSVSPSVSRLCANRHLFCERQTAHRPSQENLVAAPAQFFPSRAYSCQTTRPPSRL
jgi:hypothetical protein